ncbi:allantoicase [Phellopilus nigrolimitatus]|nr:allantoicase [Phellopilus nigrolimitatus]
MAYKNVPLDAFAQTFGTETEISSVALGGRIISVSDEFFAEAKNLIKVEPAPSLKGQFGPNGALYSGWESRRHNPTYDWCIIKFGAAGLVSGFDIDTTHFNGNEAPEVSVQALLDVNDAPPAADDSRWSEILPKVPLGPNSRHLFQITRSAKAYNYVKLNMYPDGGIARFRVYGLIRAVFTGNIDESIDLAHVFSGGRAVFVSDQHFGGGANLLLPGRGKDMGDGWETKRSRTKGHKDWVIIKLYLEKTEIDTAHFKGNFPESFELHALNSPDVIPIADESAWTCILPRTKLGAHTQHYFDLKNVQDKVYSHVRITIYPDGGIKRVRIVGKRAVDSGRISSAADGVDKGEKHDDTAIEDQNQEVNPEVKDYSSTITAIQLSSESFAPFGHVVQAFSSVEAAPSGIKITSANQGSASKFHKLAPIVSSYPPLPSGSPAATPGLSVFRSSPVDFDFRQDYEEMGSGWAVRLLERHPYTNQAFVPMGVGSGENLKGSDSLDKPGRAYLVVVAQNGKDDKPDLSTLKAFLAGAGQSVVYATGVWHHPMVVLETTMDFTCVETQIGDGSTADCEIVYLDEAGGYPRVKITPF